MGYLLQNTGFRNYLNTSIVTIGGNVGDYIEVKFSAAASNPINAYLLAGRQTSYTSILEVGDSGLLFRIGDNYLNFTSGYTQPPIGTIATVRVEKTAASEWTATLDGVSLGSKTSSGLFKVDQLLNINYSSDSALIGDSYYFEMCTDGTGVATNRWENTTGTGSVWIDQIGTNDATQGGTWPADNSEWAFYAPTAVTPVNLSITNLLATSARLNWDQG